MTQPYKITLRLRDAIVQGEKGEGNTMKETPE